MKTHLGCYKRFKTPEEVVMWVHENYSHDQLDEFDMRKHIDDPIADWKGSSYRRINELIRADRWEEYENIDIAGLQKQLLNMTVADDICASRFVDFYEYCFLLIETRFRRVAEYKGFLSTTLLKNYYSMDDIKRNRITIDILIPKGTPGMFIPEVNPKRPEFEFLMPLGLHIRRLDIKTFLVDNG